MEDINILYIHGMGGGGDSRIPSILKDWFAGLYGPERGAGSGVESPRGDEGGCGSAGGAVTVDGRKVNVVVRTYDFDPDVAKGQIASWVEELSPRLVVGESLGAVNALRLRGMPHIFVSPSLNAPVFLGYLAFLALIPGVTVLLDRIYRPRPGDRQPLHFSFKTLRHYRSQRREALQELPDRYYAFFGAKDHYRRSGVVSVRTWRRHFGPGTWAVYDGTHFMEEEYVVSMLAPKIIEFLR